MAEQRPLLFPNKQIKFKAHIKFTRAIKKSAKNGDTRAISAEIG